MSLGRLGRGELLAVIGGVLLALGLFLAWYATNPDNRNGSSFGDITMLGSAGKFAQ